MAKLTIRDIAALAGVSKSTVSLVLNNSPKVDPATRRHVLAVMRRNRYVPSFAATALAKGSTRLIGMVVPGLSWHMVASINIGVAAVTERSGFDIILYTATNDRDYGSLIDRILTSSMVSGLLVVSHEQPLEPLAQLHSDGLPVVLVNTIDADVALPSVTADNYDGALTAMDHLLQLGHERIACVQGRMVYRCCQDRYRGYLDALRSAGIQPDPELTKPGDFLPEQIRARSRELFALPADQRPTAVFAHSDVTAYAVMTAAAEAGLRVPEDVSVIGFDDIESAAQIRPPLTTIQQPFVDMGKRAAEMLLDAIGPTDEPPAGESAGESVGDEPADERPRLVMPTSLIVRASCGPAPVTRSPRGRTQTTTTPAKA